MAGPALALDLAQRFGRRPHDVLVAEHEGHVRRLIQVNLERCGYRVACAETGEQALSAVEGNLPDFIIVDALLPPDGGYVVVRRLKADPQTARVPVLVLWQRRAVGAVEQDYEPGADYYLTKPLSPAELLQIVAGG